MLARTVLYLPASRARAVEKARGLDVDVIVLDLEDAVGPDDKPAARRSAVAALTARDFRAPSVGVRLNGAKTPWGGEDLTTTAVTRPDLLVVPKVESAADLAPVLEAAPGSAVWAMIETPAALFGLDAIGAALAGRPGSALMLGANDLAVALNCATEPDRGPLHWAMSAVVAAARAHGLLAVDAVFNDLEDPERFAAECGQARRWGFDGKSLIHPSQIDAARSAFTPSADELARARRIVAAYDEPRAQGQGAIRVDGVMVERLHLGRAQRVLALHAKAETP